MKRALLDLLRRAVGTKDLSDRLDRIENLLGAEDAVQGKNLRRECVDTIKAAEPDSWFRVSLNNVPVIFPRYTLMTMHHCLSVDASGALSLFVETPHWMKMRNEIRDGSLFLDIGAATGAMTVPFALSGEKNLRIIAFEPSRRARAYLESTLLRNHAEFVTVLPFALSDTAGIMNFAELPEASEGEVPYLPETSRLTLADEATIHPQQTAYSVEVVTLDSLAERHDFAASRNIVIKIDVEGFEDKVLQGAIETLKRYKPFLSIDIHDHPGTRIKTEAACMAILGPIGYRFEHMDHVLIARAQ